MSLSPRAFKIGLYEEHLDELAFLRGQCAALRADAGHGWQAPAPFEERLEAHLDALVIGDALALQTALAAAEGGEPDTVFAAAALCCRRADAPALQTLLQGVALDEPAQAEAVGQALLLEWPAAWQAAAVRGLAQGDPRLAPVLAATAACRGWPVGDALMQALRRAAPAERPALLESVGRVVGDAPPARDLQAWFDAPEPGLAKAALRAALRLHDEAARRRVLEQPGHDDLIALAAPRSAALRLLERLRGAETEPAVIGALGQLGDLSAVRALTALLIAEPLAGAAARALYLITGGEPREQVLVPEAVNEDELSGPELDRWRTQGEAPRRADGEPFGDRVDRLSQDPAVWGQWLVDNGARFQAGRRYRCGQACTAETLLQSLGAPALPAAGRAALADELLTRHGLALPWHPALPVAAQWAALRQAAPRAQSLAHPPGRWHWAGAPLAD
jgi:hypothetical protein